MYLHDGLELIPNASFRISRVPEENSNRFLFFVMLQSDSFGVCCCCCCCSCWQDEEEMLLFNRSPNLSFSASQSHLSKAGFILAADLGVMSSRSKRIRADSSQTGSWQLFSAWTTWDCEIPSDCLFWLNLLANSFVSSKSMVCVSDGFSVASLKLFKPFLTTKLNEFKIFNLY